MPIHEFKITIVDVREDGMAVGRDIRHALTFAGLTAEYVALHDPWSGGQGYPDQWTDVATGEDR